MRPSFFALFKRGKYFHRSSPLPADGKELVRIRGDIREAERFAATAIAFAWRYDLSVRQQFWETVCHVPSDPPLSPKAEILVEPEDWADLLISNPVGKGRIVYVVECKIDADLLPHQDPTRRAFAAAGLGYGRFLAESDSRADTTFRFVVFGLARTLKFRKQPPWTIPTVLVSQRSWLQFADTFPRTALAQDLAVSLGKLNIGAFPASDTKTMKVDTSRPEIGNAVRTLAEVQRRVKWPSGRATSPVFYQQDGRWFLGIELSESKASNSAKLKKITAHPARSQMWVGYEGEESDVHTNLVVYVYCADSTGQASVEKLLKRKVRRARIKAEDPEKKYFSVTVKIRSHRLSSDAAWFCSVFEALGLVLIS